MKISKSVLPDQEGFGSLENISYELLLCKHVSRLRAYLKWKKFWSLKIRTHDG